MRDIVLCIAFVAVLPFVLKRPAYGVILWILFSVMNPHRLTYGFAFGLPFAAVTAVATMVAFALTKESRRLPLTAPVIAMALFTLWMCLTALVPINPGSGYYMWTKVMKIMLMTFVAFAVIHERQQINWVVWVIVLSLGFFGLKGGIFTVSSGGNFLVWGPAGSFIEDNNELALALVVAIPLMRYVQLQATNKLLRWFMVALMVFTAISAIGSHSRGALLAIAAMGGFLWLKSRNKFGVGLVLVVVAIAIVALMPQEWMDRMNTIRTYQEDASAMGRLNAWMMAFNLAKSNIFGGGFDIYDANVFGRYAPNPIDIHAAHSIYFQVLGEHGFIGLFLFISIGAFTWFAAGDAKRRCRNLPEFAWASMLMDLVKVSMVGFAVGGAFLSLAYFDVPYYLTVIVVAVRELLVTVGKEKSLAAPSRRATAFDQRRDVGDTAMPAPRDAAVPARVRWRGDEGVVGSSMAKLPVRRP